MAKITPQNYPRIDDVDDHYNGCLNEATLVPHQYKISEDELKRLISSAIINANKKSSRQILSIPPDAREDEIFQIYKKEGQKSDYPTELKKELLLKR